MYDMTFTITAISYDLSLVIRYQENHGDSYWMTVKNILKYLKRTKDMILIYGGRENL